MTRTVVPWIMSSDSSSDPFEFDVEIPSEEMKQKFEKWDDIYSVDDLTDMTLRLIESERLEFESEVVRFKTRYNRGKALTPELAKVAGEEPYTHDQLRDARYLIEEEADRIRLRFKRAKGIVEKEREDSFRGYVVNLVEKIQLSLFNSP